MESATALALFRKALLDDRLELLNYRFEPRSTISSEVLGVTHAQALAKTGTADGARVEEMRQLTQLQLDKIKQAAAQGKEPGSSTQSWQQTVDSVRRDDSG